MSRLTKQEIELTCREIVAAADYMSVTKADLQQVCDLALLALSRKVAHPPEFDGFILFDSDCTVNGVAVKAGTTWGPFEKSNKGRGRG